MKTIQKRLPLLPVAIETKTTFRTRRNAPDVRVVVPYDVQVSLPRNPGEDIRVPASINGTDMSTGRL